MTRHMLGDETADALKIPREPDWDDLVPWAWPRFVATREGALRLPLPADVFWAFDEIVRTGVLLYLGRAPDIWIEMPTSDVTSA